MIGGEGKGEKSNIRVNVVLNGYLGVREKFKLKNLPFVLLVRWRGSRGFCTGSVIRCNGFTFRFRHSGRVFYVFRLRDGIWNANGRTVSRLSTMIHGVISLFSVHRGGEGRGDSCTESDRIPAAKQGDQSETCVYFGTGENKPSSFIGYYRSRISSLVWSSW